MKQKYIVPGIVVFGIVVLGFGLVRFFNSFAQVREIIICRGGTPDNWTEREGSFCSSMFSGTTLAIRCSNANAYIVRTGEKDPFGNDYDSCSTSIAGYVGCSYTLAGGSEKVTVYQSACPSGVSEVASASGDSIVCRSKLGFSDWSTNNSISSTRCAWSSTWSVKCPSGTPNAFLPYSKSSGVTYIDCLTDAQLAAKGSTVKCKNPSTQGSDAVNYFFSVNSLHGQCANINATHEVIECPSGYNISTSYGFLSCVAQPPPPDVAKYLCNKTTGACAVSDDPQATSQAQCSLTCKKEVPPEPDLQCSVDKGLCRKGKVQECLTVCPATWEFIPPAGYTGTTSRLLGEGYVTGVNAEGKYLEGESATDVKIEIVTKTITEVKKETIVIEKEKLVEVTPVEVPQTADGASCESFQNNITTALQERLVVLDTFQKAGEDAASANANVKRASQQNIKAGVKELRNINKKNTAGFQCSVEHLRSMAGAVKGLDDVVISQARQNLAIMKKEEKVQPQYFGIRQDITAVENALKRISDEKRGAMQRQIQNFEQCKNDFEELVLAEGLILASEIQETAAQCKTAKTQITSLLKAKSSQPKVLKKEKSVKKASLKKKSAKKSLKGKKLKKSKKAKKVKKTKKAKSKKNKRRA